MIEIMSKTYRVGWDEVTKWNILYFMHKFKFLEWTSTQELMKAQQSKTYKR